jgi:hypothetical protein
MKSGSSFEPRSEAAGSLDPRFMVDRKMYERGVRSRFKQEEIEKDTVDIYLK